MFKDKVFDEKNLNTGNKFVYFNRCSNVEKLGFVILKDELVSFGVYKDDVLEGLGYQFTNKVRYEGVFRGGLLNGVGSKYQILKHKVTVGNFVDGDMVGVEYTEDNRNKGEEISEYKRSIHLRSMYFFNSFVQSSSLLKHTGFSEIVNKYHPQQEYLYQEPAIKSPKKKAHHQNNLNQSSSSLSYQSKEGAKYLKKTSTNTMDEMEIPVTSPLKKTISRGKAVVEEEELELKGVNLLLGKLEGGRGEGSLKGSLQAYEEIEALRKKGKKF